MSQVWMVAISPSQRWHLLELSHQQGQTVESGSKAYRRFMIAFGIDEVARVARRDGKVQAGAVRDEMTFELFELTAENVEQACKFLSTPHNPIFEDVLGSLIDVMEGLRQGGDYESPAGIAAFDRGNDLKRWEVASADQKHNHAEPRPDLRIPTLMDNDAV